MDLRELREKMCGRLVTAGCAGCKAISEEWIPGRLPRMVCGNDETLASCGGPYATFAELFVKTTSARNTRAEKPK